MILTIDPMRAWLIAVVIFLCVWIPWRTYRYLRYERKRKNSDISEKLKGGTHITEI